jgi:hypothetical protein
MARKTLIDAKKEKKDEFYTLLKDIEKELKHYKPFFKNKIVYCNCDDPYESNFFKFFAANFNNFGLKKLITTCYAGSPIVGSQLTLIDILGLKSNNKNAFKLEINEVKDYNEDGSVDLLDVEWLLTHNKNTSTLLKQGGDFRSNECIELLKQSDIICTNPPFSLFREYIGQLSKYNKDFLIIGNTNALCYKEIFRSFKENKIRTGYTNFNVGMFFIVPDDWEKFHHIDEKGNKIARVSTSCWFTSLEVERHKEFITLYKKYNPKDYPKYDNYDAINVNKVHDIPMDYKGVMGVPITFLNKFNPDQFQIIGMSSSAGYDKDIVGIPFIGEKDARPLINGKNTYARIFIKNKKVENKTQTIYTYIFIRVLDHYGTKM